MNADFDQFQREIIVENTKAGPEYTEMPKADRKKYIEAGTAAGLAAMNEGDKKKEP